MRKIYTDNVSIPSDEGAPIIILESESSMLNIFQPRRKHVQ